MNTYILQKDLPEAKAKTEYITCREDAFYGCKKEDLILSDGSATICGAWVKSLYSKSFLENNPEWFKLKEEKEYKEDWGCYYEVYENKEKISAVGSSQIGVYKNLISALEKRFGEKIPLGSVHSLSYIEKIDKSIIIDGLKMSENPYIYLFRSSGNINYLKYDAICKAIEYEVNNKKCN